MTKRSLPPAAWILTGLLCVSGPLLAQAPAKKGSTAENQEAPGANHANWQQERQRKVQDISRLLNLSPDQQNKLTQALDGAGTEARKIMPQIRQEREQIAALFKNSDDAQFNAKIDQMTSREGQLVGEMMRTYAKALKGFYSTLTPEQKTKADDLHALLAGGGFPFRMGPMGMHHGMHAPSE